MSQIVAASQLLYQFELELTPFYDHHTPSHHHPKPARTGLYCHWKHAFTQGQQLRLRIPSITCETSADTQVVACRSNEYGYQLVLAFTDEEQAFRFRMVEQLYHIHNYHQQLQQQGRRLNLNEAAGEWINRFASSFTSATASI